jgi:kinesin family protein 2/24
VPWVWAGGISTIFAYGQTGSGKTYTVTGITNLVIKEIMAMVGIESREINVCCFEVLGKKAYGTWFSTFDNLIHWLIFLDLLDNRHIFSIMEDSFGTVHLVGVQEKRPSSEQDFLDIIRMSSLLRTSAPTAKNDQSSRSHAIHRIRIVNKSDPGAVDGELFLVDLAGSEGSEDSRNHSAERLAETKDINTSLSILKDCIRGRSLWGLQQLQPIPQKKGSIHIPWRSSKLTQVLKHVFGTQEERACKTLVIACVAPSIVNSAHSKNTLRYAEMLKVPVPKTKRQKDTKNPAGWTNENVKQWIAENVSDPI